MKTRFECLLLTLGVGVVLYPVSLARAQDVTIDLEDTKQMVQGFGGINHPVWAGDLTAAQRETAFGNGPGQLGFTVLRIFISENQNDWQREVATAQRAQELGLLIFASPWNPPSSMATTINGQKHVNPQMYGDYAAHLTAFYDFMQENGVDLYAVSVQNEPDYANEWTWWSADEIVTFLRDYGGDLPFRVMAPESFQYRKAMSDPILNDPAALQNMDILGAHLYGTQVRDFPYPLFKEKGAGKELWMTEVYYPNSDDNSADRWPEALGVAWHVHSAMVEAEFQAYVWWYIRRQYGPMKEDGTISKRGYSMAHFSKFVRRGFYRVEATKNPKNEVFVSAYKGDSDVVAVIVNRNTSSQSLSFSIPGTTITSYAKYTTSGSKNLSEEGAVEAANGTFTVTLDAESVTTLHGTGDVPSTGGTGGAPGSGGAAGSPGGGGAPGTGGTPGNGGSPGLGGSPGSGGASSDGGSGGSLPTTGGSVPGSGGIGGFAPATGGTTPGTGGNATGGATPGAGGTGGLPPATGSAGGTTGGAPAVGGSRSGGGGTVPTSGGATSVASGGSAAGDPDGASLLAAPDGDAGCGCQTVGAAHRVVSLGAPLLGLLGLLSRRRRSRWT